MEYLIRQLKVSMEYLMDQLKDLMKNATKLIDAYDAYKYPKDTNRSRLVLIMERLMMLAYGGNIDRYNRWMAEINNCRAILYESCADMNGAIDSMDQTLDVSYAAAVCKYYADCDTDDGLIAGKDLIPDKCPWNASTLLCGEIDRAIAMLPDAKHLSTTDIERKKFYRFCKYVDDNCSVNTSELPSRCEDCDNLINCTSSCVDLAIKGCLR